MLKTRYENKSMDVGTVEKDKKKSKSKGKSTPLPGDKVDDTIAPKDASADKGNEE